MAGSTWAVSTPSRSGHPFSTVAEPPGEGPVEGEGETRRRAEAAPSMGSTTVADSGIGAPGEDRADLGRSLSYRELRRPPRRLAASPAATLTFRRATTGLTCEDALSHRHCAKAPSSSPQGGSEVEELPQPGEQPVDVAVVGVRRQA